jgi:hypothetical protein
LTVVTSCTKKEEILATGKTKIIFSNINAIISRDYFSDIIESFKKVYPMFEVEEVRYGSFEDLEEAVMTKEIDELPTIVQATPANISKFLEKDLVVNLNQYIDNSYITSEYIDYIDDDKWLYNDIIGLTNDNILDIIPGFMFGIIPIFVDAVTNNLYHMQESYYYTCD